MSPSPPRWAPHGFTLTAHLRVLPTSPWVIARQIAQYLVLCGPKRSFVAPNVASLKSMKLRLRSARLLTPPMWKGERKSTVRWAEVRLRSAPLPIRSPIGKLKYPTFLNGTERLSTSVTAADKREEWIELTWTKIEYECQKVHRFSGGHSSVGISDRWTRPHPAPLVTSIWLTTFSYIFFNKPSIIIAARASTNGHTWLKMTYFNHSDF